ncbi:hypothetical protein HNY73_012063 [Argiope bruennichi]|uniref:Uncharacterized protein n=1 Tax=Argiope bruennichi TaxID=94029 RepID=A0A8T0ETW7_ARGBR|nr:hypothetical protein HNY73_012063 [Argiope bruennichi]
MGCTPVHVTPDAAMLSIPPVPEVRQSALASGRGRTHEHLSITNHLPKRHAATSSPPATGPAAQEALLDMRAEVSLRAPECFRTKARRNLRLALYLLSTVLLHQFFYTSSSNYKPIEQ